MMKAALRGVFGMMFLLGEGCGGTPAGLGVDIVTIGQYLRPTTHHLPVARWWTPEEFDAVRANAQAMGFAHVEAGPLVRSSYHARAGIDRMVGASS